MRTSPRRWSGFRGAVVAAVVGGVLFSGAPLTAWSAPTPTPSPTPTESATTQDEGDEGDDAREAAPTDGATPADEESPAEEESASDEPTDESSEDTEEPAEPEESASPEESDESESPEEESSQSPSAEESSSESATAQEDEEVVAQVVPPATGNSAVITVKVGGVRATQTAVGNLAGVQLGFYDAATGGVPAFTCTSDADGDCSITVPNTQIGGGNRDRRFWIRQITTASDYYTSPNLGTGTDPPAVASDPYRFQTGDQLRNGTIYRSTVDFMIATGTTNNEASGGIWQNSLNNPTFPAKCGINVAILHDLSNSLSAGDLTAMKAASSGFVDALVGTPSQVSTFTFATAAPAAGAANATLPLTSVSTAAGATTVKNRINGMVLPGGNDGGTNWDRGIYQVAQSASQFDVLVVITDGNPTYYGNAEGPGSRTRFREVENGIFSANATKAEGTKLIAFGVGAGVGSAGSGLNLRSISGPTLNTDYYQTANYGAAGTQLRNLALGNCRGSITVVKQVVPSTTATGSTAGAQPQGGWDFTGAGSPGVTFDAPTTRTTAVSTGAANFPLTFSGGTTSGTVTLTETLQSGYVLHQGVAGQNAVCTRVDTGATIVPGNVTNGFTVSANSAYPISCTVYNKAPAPLASVVVNKQWRINGTDYNEGNQPSNFVAGLTIAGTGQGWGVERTGFRLGDRPVIDETINNVPIQCTVNSRQVVLANGTTVAANLPYTSTLIAGQNTYIIRNVVTCQTRLTLTKQVEYGNEPVTSWTLDAVAPAGAAPGPNGVSGSPGATGATVTPGVTYPLAESGTTPTTVNYAQFVNPTATLIPGSTGSWTCVEVGTDGTTVIPGFADGLNGGVTVPIGKWVSCTATNETASLRLVKEVVNDSGGTAAPSDWNLTATPTGTIPPGLTAQTRTGAALADAQYFNVRPGVGYALSESALPGYTNTDIECEVISPRADATTVTLQPGDQGTCWFVNNDNPATLTLVKNVVNDNGGDADPENWTLSAEGPTPISGPGNSTEVTDQIVSAGTYTLAESGGPSGYTPSAWSCAGGTVTGASVVVANGADVVCTISNNDQSATLTLEKIVINAGGGTAQPSDWTLSAAGPTPISGPGNTGPVTGQAVSAGTYTLSESDGPGGYTASAWSCTGADVSDDAVSVPTGGTVICTISNVAQPSNLTLTKTVVNNNGGTAAPTDWALAADGPTPISGQTGTDAVTNAVVGAGTYTLSESGGPEGYSASSWSCTGGTQAGSSVTIAVGQSAACTIVNDDQPATLSLVKEVVNGTTGATAGPEAWTLSASGPTPVEGVGDSDDIENQTVDAGSYTLSESGGPDGYTPSAWTCEGGDLTDSTVIVPNGGDVTCRIVNTAQQAELTLIKLVTNDNGGEALPTDWTLTATGPTTGVTGSVGDDAITTAPVAVGNYTLTESGGPRGYTAGDWTCANGGLEGSIVTVPLGANVICTIRNDDQPATLTLVKEVQNGTTGGDAGPEDWTLNATGPSLVTGPGNSAAVTDQTVNAGSFDLSESGGPEGYVASDWDCGALEVSDSRIVVPNGAVVTCTIVNTAQPVSLTLIKTVVPGTTGATTPATAWTLTATGPTVIEGTSPATDTTEIGTYSLSEDGPEGWSPSNWVCTGASGSTADTVTLGLGDAAICAITNTAQQPTLTLVKTVTNDNGGSAVPTAWTLSAVGPTTGIVGPVGDDAVTDVPVAIGDYELNESGVPTGYTAGDWSCEGGTLNGSTVSVVLGDDVTCTINNNDQPGRLTLVKVVDPDGSGTEYGPADWTVTAEPQDIEGQDSVSGNGDPTTPDGVNGVPVFAGQYALSEEGPAGFEGSVWECTGGVVTGALVTVPNGGNVTCTITNTAIAPRLTLVKTVINDNGGTAQNTAWTLSADGPSPISGATGTPPVTNAAVEVGSYTLDEDGPTGYIPSEWVCVGNTVPIDGAVITLAEGDDVTCTITNDDQSATLTLDKTVDNGTTGATAAPAAWVLAAAGPTPISGPGDSREVTNRTVNAGAYALSESDGPAGYTASAWTCGDAVQTGATVTVPNGGNVTCIITNTAQQPYLTLVKDVVKDNGGTAEPTDWTLAADGPTTGITGATGDVEVTRVPVQIGDYVLSETDGPPGYTASAWSCPDATLTGATVTVALGDDTTCTITNDDAAGNYLLTKTSDPVSGSTVNPGETVTYTLTARNASAGVVRNAVITDDLSDVLDDATIAGIGGGGTLDETTLSWTLPTPFNPGEVATLSYTVIVDADSYYAELRNVATPGPGGECVPSVEGEELTAAADQADAVTAAAVGCDTEHPIPGWSLEKQSDPASGSVVFPGEQVTYTLTVTNDSNGVVSDAVVTDDLTDVLAYASLDSVPAGATLTGTTLTWNVPIIEPGYAAQLSYTVTVDDDAYDASFANVAVPGDGGQCTTCTTTHETPPEPSDPDNADEPGLPDTGGTSLIPLGLGAGFLITGALLLAESRRRRQWVAVRIDPKR